MIGAGLVRKHQCIETFQNVSDNRRVLSRFKLFSTKNCASLSDADEGTALASRDWVDMEVPWVPGSY